MDDAWHGWIRLDWGQNAAVLGGALAFMSTMVYAYLRPHYGDFKDAKYGWAYLTMLMSGFIAILASLLPSYGMLILSLSFASFEFVCIHFMGAFFLHSCADYPSKRC